jgi:hypothetical protein
MTDVTNSQFDAPIRVQELPGVAPDAELINREFIEQSFAFSDLQKWCEARRTKWPSIGDGLLPDSQFHWIYEVGSEVRSKGRIDFSEVPAVLSEIIATKLSPARAHALLSYYLGFLAELIIVDSIDHEDFAADICSFLKVGIAPAAFGFDTVPPFLGILTLPPDADPIEAELLEKIGLSISACIGSFKSTAS